MVGAPAGLKKNSKYQQYLASREWGLLKEQVRERSGGVCERCIIAPYQATHHLTYEHLYAEPLDDLLAVCDPCHAWLSGIKGARDPLNDHFLVSERISNADGNFYHLVIPAAGTIKDLGCIHCRPSVLFPDCRWCTVDNLLHVSDFISLLDLWS